MKRRLRNEKNSHIYAKRHRPNDEDSDNQRPCDPNCDNRRPVIQNCDNHSTMRGVCENVIERNKSGSRRALSEPPVHFQAVSQNEQSFVEHDSENELIECDNIEPSGDNDFQNDIETHSDGEHTELDYFTYSAPQNCKESLGGAFREQTIQFHFQLIGPRHISVLDFQNALESVLTRMIREAFRDAEPEDGVMIIISCLKNMDHPVSIPLTRFKNLYASHIISAMESARISGKVEFKISDGIQFILKHIKNPSNKSFKDIRAGSKGAAHYVFSNIEKSVEDRRCLVKIENEQDQMCMQRSISVGFANNIVRQMKRICKLPNATTTDHEELKKALSDYTKIRKPKRYFQRKYALDLCEKAGISPQMKCGIEEAKKIEIAINIYIKIVASEQFDKIAYDGTKSNFRNDLPVHEDNIVYLLRYFATDERGESCLHYAPILNISQYFGRPYYCIRCDHSYNEPHGHICFDVSSTWCYSCYSRDCQPINDTNHGKCSICEVYFRSESCRQKHGKMKCYKKFYCTQCKSAITRDKKILSDGTSRFLTDSECRMKHICVKLCPVCQDEIPVMDFHKCFIKETPFKDPSDKLMFLDFETDQSSKEHIPIYCHITYYDEKDNLYKNEMIGLNKEHPNIKKKLENLSSKKSFKAIP